MAATTITRAGTGDTDANFRLWGKAIADQLLAGGLVQTADTGQINWATVLKPTTINTNAGYEIWRSSDATVGNGLNNFYFKLQYGSNSGANSPRIEIQIGWGSDGAGNLTGFKNAAGLFSYSTGAAATTTLYNCNLSAGPGYVSVMMFAGLPGNGFYLGIERTKNAAGADQDEVLLLLNTSAAHLSSQIINRTGGVFPMEVSPTAQALVSNTNAVQGAVAGYSLQFGQKGGLSNPSVNCFGTGTTTLGAAQTTTTISAYGSARTYIVNAPNGALFSTSPQQVLLARYE